MIFKLKRKQEPVEVPWKDGAILLIRKALQQEILEETPEVLGSSGDALFYLASIKASIVGWKEIYVNNILLHYNKENKENIFDAVISDLDLLAKIKVAIQDTTENFENGLIASTTTDLTSKIA